MVNTVRVILEGTVEDTSTVLRYPFIFIQVEDRDIIDWLKHHAVFFRHQPYRRVSIYYWFNDPAYAIQFKLKYSDRFYDPSNGYP